ncbi:Transcriptional regulatory protein pro1 [Cyphellophora attinorum]|uniref:Transcriptional regulatory protein pro1 n=1 Tax=Cyphellophora attinorum TaxID=1664694 RepID=A0A0N1HT46_9EURO|nr:Transcriptional regulatory protein pro1 [Phialophora attinorum]KPI39587.1 Transcriptional regulatory protein pro1 [Phialophora attinorum]
MATAVEKNEAATKAASAAAAKAAAKMHRRSRSGCFTCRLRRKKCDEGRPKCKACRHLGLTCEYKRPLWWSNQETRHKQKDEIKTLIKRTKTNEKSMSSLFHNSLLQRGRPVSPPNPSHVLMSLRKSHDFLASSSSSSPSTSRKHVPTSSSTTGTQPGSKHGSGHGQQYSQSGASSPNSEDYDQFNQFPTGTPGLYDPFCMPMYSGSMTQTPVQYTGYHPYEVDVKTERQMFVNDVPTRRDSSISTFSTWIPPPEAMLPSYPATQDQWSGTVHQSTDSYYTSHMPSLNTDIDDLSHEEDLDFNFFQYSHPHHQHHVQSQPAVQIPQQPRERTEVSADISAQIPLDDVDRPLFSYMLSNVLPLLFPILNANQHGSVRTDILLPALENNKAYLHSCLTAAATHQRSSLDIPGGPSVNDDDLATIDDSIVRHKYAFVQEVVNALTNDTHHDEILEATLGMITFGTCVGRAPPSTLPPPAHTLPSPTIDDHQISAPAAMARDIPWHSHFQAATELVNKLMLPTTLESMPATHASPPFNMTLTAWIDILGSTMLGRSPTFANTYRTKHLSGSTSGLAELMGCHDGVMYLLSEIACLDSLKRDGKLDDHAICQHVASLGEQLNATETVATIDETTGMHVTLPAAAPRLPYSRSGALRPRQLSKNITAVFQKAARVYLCSLVPAYQKTQVATCNLIDQMADLLEFIPSGPLGFDRSLVWPYLICGANSVPSSKFRRVLAQRVELMGDALSEMGSFGKMVKLLHEVWRVGDEALLQGLGCEGTPLTANGGNSPIVGSNCGVGSTHMVGNVGGIGIGGTALAQQAMSTPTMKSQITQQNIHWRDVMQMNGWDFLLI